MLYNSGAYLDVQIPSRTDTHYFWVDTWIDLYNNEPVQGSWSLAALGKLMGGEASMWAEQVDATSVSVRVWPRACATAERLWSPASVKNADAARPRLNAHRCTMARRGIASSPIDPDYCPLSATFPNWESNDANVEHLLRAQLEVERRKNAELVQLLDEVAQHLKLQQQQ